MATERLVVVGGDAAGMAAASQARRLRKPDELAITAFERGHFTSYSACGIPYWVGGDVDGPDALIARTAEEHRARDIDLRMRTEVTELDLDRGRVRTRELDSGGRESWTGFDKLVLATGARPRRPGLPGIDAPGCTVCRPSTTARPCWTPSTRRPAVGRSSWVRAISAWRWPRR